MNYFWHWKFPTISYECLRITAGTTNVGGYIPSKSNCVPHLCLENAFFTRQTPRGQLLISWMSWNSHAWFRTSEVSTWMSDREFKLCHLVLCSFPELQTSVWVSRGWEVLICSLNKERVLLMTFNACWQDCINLFIPPFKKNPCPANVVASDPHPADKNMQEPQWCFHNATGSQWCGQDHQLALLLSYPCSVHSPHAHSHIGWD